MKSTKGNEEQTTESNSANEHPAGSQVLGKGRAAHAQ
jgi:hypothetical protein